MKKTALVALVAGALGACVSVSSTNLNPSANFAPVPQADVRIFQSEEEVPEPYVKLALFNASGSDTYTDQSDLFNKIREKAAERGCNGVVLQGSKEAGTAEKIFFGAGADREAQAVCVRYGDAVEDTDAGAEQSAGEGSNPNLPIIEL